MGVYCWGGAVLNTFGAILSRINVAQRDLHYQQNILCGGYYVLVNVYEYFHPEQFKVCHKHSQKKMVNLMYILTCING